MAEINLLEMYPKVDRPIEERSKTITPDVVRVARQFGREFFDGDRLYGYGGYRYDGRWRPIVERFRDHYGLPADARILDIGCAKGFMLHDFHELMPGATIAGLDVSAYAIEHAMESVRRYMMIGDAQDLPYDDHTFDLVIAINTIHNLERGACAKAVREIVRVTRGDAFITVDAWRDERERERLQKWILTAKTYMSVHDWKRFFVEAGYAGDYYWFIA